MPRGRASQIGDTYVSANGYHHTKTEEGFKLTHHLVAERKLGRRINTKFEQVYFIDGNKKNLSPSNIAVREKNPCKLGKRIAELDARIEELQAQRDELAKELEAQKSI